MKFEIEIEKGTKTGSNKRKLIASITSKMSFSVGSNFGSGYCLFNSPTFVRVYNLQKLNKKTSQKKVKLKNPKKVFCPKRKEYIEITHETKSKVVRKAHWLINYYDMPFEVLKLTKQKVDQNVRNFKIVPKK